MSNINFFRVMAKGNSIDPQPPVLTCALELADFNLDPVSNKNFDNFKSYSKTYFSRIAVASTASGFEDYYIHNLYAGWFPTASLSAPYQQLIYQFSQTESNAINPLPDLSAMQPFTSSVNSTSSFDLPGDTMKQGGIDSQPIFFQTIQVPNTGSLIHFGAASNGDDYLFQYDLDTNFDVTTLNTASRVYEELRQLTASQANILQTSYNANGSQMYQIQQNYEGNISPFNHWTILHVIDLSTPYDLSSYNSSNTSSYILENELSNLSGPYPSNDSNFVEVSTLNKRNDSNQVWTSSMYYTNYINDTVIKFRINSDRSLSNEESLTVNDFPMQIRYSAPATYEDYNTNEFKAFFVSNSLGPYNVSVNVNRTSSCLAPYNMNAGIAPTTRISNIEFVSIFSMLQVDVTVVNQLGINPLSYDIEFSPNSGASWVDIGTYTFSGTTYIRTDEESVPWNTDPKWFRIYDLTNDDYSEVYQYSN